MASDWKEVPLGHLYDFRSGLSKHRSEFGFGCGFLSFKDVFYNYFVPNELNELVNSTEKERANCSILRGDVFLTRTSETMDELGMSCVALRDYENATFNGFTKRLRPKHSSKIVPEYAAYFFRSPKFRSEVTSMSSLSTRASLNNEMLGRLKMTLPSVIEQTAIGKILKSLDDKSKLNQRMNETLKAMARTIFKSWFVDFDPVRAKAESRDPGLPDEVAALFPDSFQDSELGEIPKGWEIGIVSDLGEVICGKTPPTRDADNYGEDIPFITIPDMHGKVFVTQAGKYLSIQGAKTQPKKFLPPKSICVSCIATPGLVILTSEKSQTNQQINSVSPEDYLGPYYCFQLLRRLGDQIRAGGSGGSVLLNLNKTQFSKIKILLAEQPAIEAYHKLVEPLFDRLLSNERESHTLASLRDTILPKLISGELRVPDAEKFVKETSL